MKKIVPKIDFQSKHLLSVAAGVLLTLTQAFAQLNTTGLHVNFGIDGDTRSGYTKFGTAPTPNNSDDWFSFGPNGKGVIDTSNSAFYKSQLQSNKNISFLKWMNQPQYAIMNGKLWIDGVYLRDHTSANEKDSTAYTSGAKNTQNPNTWLGGRANVPEKTDIVDGYAHFRRDGIAITDSLWLYTGVSTVGTLGDRFFDIELFKKGVSYNSTTGTFTTLGLSEGHTEWLFDATGKIIQTGDLIISVSYTPGQAPVVDLRIWVSKITFQTVHPTRFKFGGSYDGGLLYGYANIRSLNNTTAFGSAAGNFSTNAAATADSTYSTPWGTVNPSNNWSANYSQLQLVEIGLNLTRIGIDPSLYNLQGSCDPIFRSLFFKSRSSNAFSANLQDFAGPINFSLPAGPYPNYMVTGDTLTCSSPYGQLTVSNFSNIGSFTWSTPDGRIIGSNADSTSITVNRHGMYTLTSRVAIGCPVVRVDHIFVPADSTAPIATADITLTPDGEVQLIGGDAVASSLMSSYGASQGLTWKWTGPNGFSSNLQNPIVQGDWIWGSYYLEVKELRNGCKSTAMLDVSFHMKHNTVTGEQGTLETFNLLNSGSRWTVEVNQEQAAGGVITLHSTTGQLLASKQIGLKKGFNSIELPMLSTKQVAIVSVYVDHKLRFVRKVML